MKRTTHLGSAILATCIVLSNGCALTQKATPINARYFSPEPAASSRSPAAERAAGSGLELRLGRVMAGAHIRERIVYRDSEYELGFYDDRLWSERPDAYLRRA